MFPKSLIHKIIFSFIVWGSKNCWVLFRSSDLSHCKTIELIQWPIALSWYTSHGACHLIALAMDGPCFLGVERHNGSVRTCREMQLVLWVKLTKGAGIVQGWLYLYPHAGRLSHLLRDCPRQASSTLIKSQALFNVSLFFSQDFTFPFPLKCLINGIFWTKTHP